MPCLSLQQTSHQAIVSSADLTKLHAMLKKTAIFHLLLPLIFLACQKKEEKCYPAEEVAYIPIELQVQRMENRLFEAKGDGDIAFWLEEYPYFTKKYLQEDLYSSREALISNLTAIPQDSLMQELYNEVTKEYGQIDDILTDLELAFKHIKYYYPEFEVPRIYTFVSGFTSDLYIDKEMIVIGLDYFLPSDHKFQPPEVPQYMTDRYNREHLVPMILMAISSAYIESDLSDNSLLAEMVFYGKAYHFTKAMMPCTSEELVIGYTPEELAACYANEEFIWEHFIEAEIIYETNPFEIRKYTGEAPFTDAISPDAPGRVGRWIGWNIVDAYAEEQGVDLVDLMRERDAKKIFMNSGYKPSR